MRQRTMIFFGLLLSFSCLPWFYFSPFIFPLNKVFSSKWVKGTWNNNSSNGHFYPTQFACIEFLANILKFLSAHYEKLEHIFTHFSLPVLKLLRQTHSSHVSWSTPFSNFSGTFSPFIQNIYGGTFCPGKLPTWNIDLGTFLSTKLPVQKIHRGWHPRKLHSGQNGHQSIRPFIQSFIHPRPVGLVRNWTAESARACSRRTVALIRNCTTESARLQETHGWNQRTSALQG